MNSLQIDELKKRIGEIDTFNYYGKVSRITGLTVESIGPIAQIGEICKICSMDKRNTVLAEVIGFKDHKVILMPYGDLAGISSGSLVVSTKKSLEVKISDELKGRILDGLGNPIDGKGEILSGEYCKVDNTPPNPLARKRIKEILPLGIKAIDSLITCGNGQRIGIFAGSGVGKSTLLGMIARNAKADINVITLVGERGREVNDFIEKDLKEEGLKKSVIVVATSDQPALIRLKSAMIGTAIAEYFRDKGLNVLLLMDSVTRFAMAQREIGMAMGEPPVSRGYTPSVFTVLPKLLERTGTSDKGCITGLYTVLVDGDDLNEPITDSVRGILDGHIVLSRALANKNHYPAIDVLASISRLMNDIAEGEHIDAANYVKNKMAIYKNAEDLINIGAYKNGSNPEIDEAIGVNKDIEKLLRQKIDEAFDFEQTIDMLKSIGKH
ncbi:MAG: flagellar protein export ATPase FliI [Clostridia bacterium]|nr:flagellar protein export ATPase FliI [Clostridia bacterium]